MKEKGKMTLKFLLNRSCQCQKTPTFRVSSIDVFISSYSVTTCITVTAIIIHFQHHQNSLPDKKVIITFNRPYPPEGGGDWHMKGAGMLRLVVPLRSIIRVFVVLRVFWKKRPYI